MSDFEEIETAIGKLERLKADSTRVWARTVKDLETLADDREIGLSLHDMNDADGELALTLHRTIDAQLAILMAGRTAFGRTFDDTPYFELPGWAAEARSHSLTFARAINGTAS